MKTNQLVKVGNVGIMQLDHDGRMMLASKVGGGFAYCGESLVSLTEATVRVRNANGDHHETTRDRVRAFDAAGNLFVVL